MTLPGLETYLYAEVCEQGFRKPKVMSGGGSTSVVGAMFEDIGILLYPTAAAQAVVLMTFLTILIALILRVADIRMEIVQ